MNAMRYRCKDSDNDAQWCERVVGVGAINQSQRRWDGNI